MPSEWHVSEGWGQDVQRPSSFSRSSFQGQRPWKVVGDSWLETCLKQKPPSQSQG